MINLQMLVYPLVVIMNNDLEKESFKKLNKLLLGKEDVSLDLLPKWKF